MLDVTAYRAWDEAATASVVVSDLIERAIAGLDAFLTFVSGFRPRVLEPVVEALQSQWVARAEADRRGYSGTERAEGLPGRLAERTALLESYVGFVSRAAGWVREAETSGRPTDLLRTDLCRSFYLTRYAMLEAVVSVLGREQGIEQMKRFLDEEIGRRPAPASPPGTLREMRTRDIEWNLDDGGQNAVSALMTEHRMLKKVTACRIEKVLAPYGDPELLEAIACYPDHASIRRANPHFTLTRTQTLIGAHRTAIPASTTSEAGWRRSIHRGRSSIRWKIG